MTARTPYFVVGLMQPTYRIVKMGQKLSNVRMGLYFKIATQMQHTLVDVRRYSLSQRTVNDWNKLSSDCVLCKSSIKFNMFMNRLNNYLEQDTHRLVHVDSR